MFMSMSQDQKSQYDNAILQAMVQETLEGRYVTTLNLWPTCITKLFNKNQQQP